AVTSAYYTLSLHDALPISWGGRSRAGYGSAGWSIPVSLAVDASGREDVASASASFWLSRYSTASAASTYSSRSPASSSNSALTRSEEHTSELQSRGHLVCR